MQMPCQCPESVRQYEGQKRVDMERLGSRVRDPRRRQGGVETAGRDGEGSPMAQCSYLHRIALCVLPPWAGRGGSLPVRRHEEQVRS